MFKGKSSNIKAGILAGILLTLWVINAGPQAIVHGDGVSKKIITDMAGRQVEIHLPVRRVACLTGAAYEKVFLLGESRKIVVRQGNKPPWMARTNPQINKIATTSGDPNIEELLHDGVEVVFPFYDPQQLEQLKNAGIVSVITRVPLGEDKSNEELDAQKFVALIKKEIRLFGAVLGDHAAGIAEEWCKYYDRKVKYVTERTARISEKQRPKVYYVRGPDALSTQSYDQNISRYAEMAGANMVVKTLPQENLDKVNMEQMIAWNPDVILVGRQYSTDLVLKDTRWSNIHAVRAGKVYTIPEGTFYWDSGSEGVLLMEFIAQKLYPELFRDLDMKREVKDYYKRFYHCQLTADEIEKILHGLSPDGSRVNMLQN